MAKNKQKQTSTKRNKGLLANPYSWVAASIFALFGMYNILLRFSVYHWVESYIRRAFIQNEAINVENLSQLVSADIRGTAIVGGIFLLFLIASMWRAKKLVTANRFADLYQPIIGLVLGVSATVIAGIITGVLPVSVGHGGELFVILIAFLAGASLFLMLASASWSNYNMEKGYIIYPVIFLVVQGLYLFGCWASAPLLPDFTLKNVVVSSQIVWSLIFFIGYYCVVRATRKSSGRNVGMVAVTENQDPHDEHNEEED